MEEEEIQTHQQQQQQHQPPASKFSRVGNNNNGRNGHCLDDDDEEGEEQLIKKPHSNSISNDAMISCGNDGANRLRGWHHSSRIVRVSRASGGKDRHSKVWTSKGLRDRRVRLSVTTAIQFYDLQDRLGYDQPSKAIEWLINAASDSIAELPTLNSPFPETTKQLSDDKRESDGAEEEEEQEQGFDSADLEIDGDPSFINNNQHQLSLSRSACSTSTSETSKGSGLSLSRPDIRGNRVKARERARERTAKEKKDNESRVLHEKISHNSSSSISQSPTFTELLTSGISSSSSTTAAMTTTHSDSVAANLFTKGVVTRQWPLTPMDYFGTQNSASNFSGQIQLGGNNNTTTTTNTIPHGMSAMSMDQQLQQHFSYVPDHNLVPVVAASTTNATQSDYNLNFTISSGFNFGAAGFNRGTLQSNSSPPPPQQQQQTQQSLFPHLQRFSSQNSSTLDVSANVPFFIGASPPHAMENHHHHRHQPQQFPPGLHLCYGDDNRHSDHKGKGKN